MSEKLVRRAKAAGHRGARVAKRAAKVAVAAGHSAALATAGKIVHGLDHADNFFNSVAAGVALRQGYLKARERGATKGQAAGSAVKHAALPLTFALAPVAAYVGSRGANLGHHIATQASKAERAARHTVHGEFLADVAAASRLTGSALRVVAKAGVYGNAIQAAYGGYQGMKQEDNTLAHKARGFGRGALETIDPSAIWKEHGYVERGYNKLFGGPAKPAPVKEAKAHASTKFAFAGMTSPTTAPASTKTSTPSPLPTEMPKPIHVSASASASHSAPRSSGRPRGFANPATQRSAQAARKKSTKVARLRHSKRAATMMA